GPQGARAGIANHAHPEVVSGAPPQHDADSGPWRLSPRPGPVHRPRFRDHRLRGRADSLPLRTAAEATRDARCRGHASLVLLCLPGGLTFGACTRGAFGRAAFLVALLGGFGVRCIFEELSLDRG